MAIIGSLILLVVFINGLWTIINNIRLFIAIKKHGGCIQAGEALLQTGHKMGPILIAFGYSSKISQALIAIPFIGIFLFSIFIVVQIILNPEAIKWTIIIVYIIVCLLFGIFVSGWLKRAIMDLKEYRS